MQGSSISPHEPRQFAVARRRTALPKAKTDLPRRHEALLGLNQARSTRRREDPGRAALHSSSYAVIVPRPSCYSPKSSSQSTPQAEPSS